MARIILRSNRFLMQFVPLFAFLIFGFVAAWVFGIKKQKNDAQILITEFQDSRSNEIRGRILRLDQALKMIVKQNYFLEDFHNLQDAFPRYAFERRVKSALPVLRTLLGQYYKIIFDENNGSRLAKTRVEDNVNLLSETSLAAQINYLQRAKGENRDFVNDGTRWSEINGRRLADWRLWVENLGADNLHWVDIDRHDLFFSVGKNIEFATSLKYGPFADSHLSKFVSQVLSSPKNTETLMSDFEAELIRWDVPRVYLGLPVDEDGRRIGAFVVEFSPDQLAKLFKGDRPSEGGSAEFIVDSGDYNFWTAPNDLKHPSRSPTDPNKLQLLQWMDLSRSRVGSDRWISFRRETQDWWGSVKPIRVFNQDLWIVNEYSKSEFERPTLFSKAEFQAAFLVGIVTIMIFSLLLSQFGGPTPAASTLGTREKNENKNSKNEFVEKITKFEQSPTSAPENSLPAEITSDTYENVTPIRANVPTVQPSMPSVQTRVVTRDVDWDALDQPILRADRQLLREFENLQSFSELLKSRQSEIVALGELCRQMKSTLEGHRSSNESLLSDVEDRLIIQDNLRFPSNWIESLNTSIRKLEILCFSLSLEVKKGGSTPNVLTILEEFETIQKKLQRESSTVEKWSLQIDDPVKRIPTQAKLVEFAESFQSLDHRMEELLLQLSLRAEKIIGQYSNVIKAFVDMKQNDGMNAAVNSIRSALETLKAEYAGNSAAHDHDLAVADEMEALIKEFDQKNKSKKKAA